MSNKRYLETKLARAMCVLITAKKYENDPKKLAEFIQENKSYFPNISESFLELLKSGYLQTYVEDTEHKELIPKFIDLHYEKHIKKN